MAYPWFEAPWGRVDFTIDQLRHLLDLIEGELRRGDADESEETERLSRAAADPDAIARFGRRRTFGSRPRREATISPSCSRRGCSARPRFGGGCPHHCPCREFGSEG